MALRYDSGLDEQFPHYINPEVTFVPETPDPHSAIVTETVCSKIAALPVPFYIVLNDGLYCIVPSGPVVRDGDKSYYNTSITREFGLPSIHTKHFTYGGGWACLLDDHNVLWVLDVVNKEVYCYGDCLFKDCLLTYLRYRTVFCARNQTCGLFEFHNLHAPRYIPLPDIPPGTEVFVTADSIAYVADDATYELHGGQWLKISKLEYRVIPKIQWKDPYLVFHSYIETSYVKLPGETKGVFSPDQEFMIV